MYGESGSDLLVAGRTTYDTLPGPLQRISAEWSSTAPYTTRVRNVLAGTGAALSGTGIRLERGTKLFADRARDHLFGGLHEDLYLSESIDLNLDRVVSERQV